MRSQKSIAIFGNKQRLLSIDMATKVVQHVPGSFFKVLKFSSFQVFKTFLVPSFCLTFRHFFGPPCTVDGSDANWVCFSRPWICFISELFDKNNTNKVFFFFLKEVAATRAKEKLHGSYLYTGSCALDLKIEYGTKERLDVRENSDTHWDYTKAGPVDVGTAKKLLKVLKT